MPLTPFPVEQFGGLRLDIDSTEVGTSGAVDLGNVEFDMPGQLRVRDGTVAAKTIASISTIGDVFGYQTSIGTSHLIVAYFGATTNVMAAYNTKSTFVLVASTTVPAAHNFRAVQFGTPTSSRVYIANGNDTIWRYDGAAFTQPAGMPLAAHVALSGRSNRLVAGNIVGTSSSRVQFSDAGNAESWTSTSWVDLTPGDGSAITGLASWRDLVFAFKQQRFFVFTSESTLSDGSPVFNSHPVDGYGAIGPPAAGRNGVYFFDGRAVWLTTGSTPQRISGPIEPFLRGEVTINGHTAPTSVLDETVLYWSLGKLYMPMPTTSATLTLVFDEQYGYWTAYEAPATSYSSARIGDKQFTMGLNTSGIYYFDHAAANDAGTAIPWSYTTGYSSAGGYFRQRIVSSGERKKHFKTDILGSGTVTHQLLALNARPTDIADPGASVTLGTAPAIARGSRRRGVRGTHFAHKLSGSGQAVVSGLTYWLSEISLDT